MVAQSKALIRWTTTVTNPKSDRSTGNERIELDAIDAGICGIENTVDAQ